MKNYLLLIGFSLITFLYADQMVVVGEVFTETWWPYCPDARAALNQMND